MPLYVHEVDARIVPQGPPSGDSDRHGLRREEFEALVQAVVHEMERRERQARSLQQETAITGQNRPPSLGT